MVADDDLTAADAESARLTAIRYYELPDCLPPGSFDRLAAVAARLFQVPMVSVSFVLSDKVALKACYGLPATREVPRKDSVAALAVFQDDPMVVPDVAADPRLAAKEPARQLGIRFFAAAPMITPDGQRLGSINIMDTSPRDLQDSDAAVLADLAAAATEQVQLRASAMRAARLEHDLRAQVEADRAQLESFAGTLQATLLPPELPAVPGVRLAAHYHPFSSRDVGGDFYDVFPITDGRWVFVLGDVSGKGAEAAAVTSLIRYALRAAAFCDPEPISVLDQLNDVLMLDPADSAVRFCTLMYGLIEPRGTPGARVAIGTGGHPPALLRRADGRVQSVRPARGMLVGAFADARFGETAVVLLPGDTLLLYTDGLADARTGTGAFFEEDGVIAALRECREGSAEAVVASLADIVKGLGGGVTDDVALLAMSVP
jgi:sigma-B regulation protein RsbU (phosphoserine phosphatase)